MKKILFALLSLFMCAQSINAQVMEVYKNGILQKTYDPSKEAFKVKFREPHEYVDLGLPSRTLWATCNVGAETPEEYGFYFAWGETWGYKAGEGDVHEFKWTNYKWMMPGKSNRLWIKKYCLTDYVDDIVFYYGDYIVGDNRTKLESDDDAATVNWGSNWCMPTVDQFKELINPEYTTSKFTSQNGINGLLVKSRINGKTLFLPATGFYDSSIKGRQGYYWTSELKSETTSDAMILAFTQAGQNMDNTLRYSGITVRAVRVDKINRVTSLSLNKSTISLMEDATETLTATVHPYNATNKNITWTSSDTDVATVDATGKVTGVSPGTATITVTSAEDNSITATCTVTVVSYEYVDLGLESGTLWATCNIGATTPEAYGFYFAWGETQGYTSASNVGRSFDWSTYKWMKSGQSLWSQINKYTFADGQSSASWYSNGTFVGDGKKKLDSADDAATVNWGRNWMMPTHAQQAELVNSKYTSTEWTEKNGVKGLLITSKMNGNTLFLPAAGYRYYDELCDDTSYGHYWSNELHTGGSDMVWVLDFSAYGVYAIDNANRYNGYSVRAVRASDK